MRILGDGVNRVPFCENGKHGALGSIKISGDKTFLLWFVSAICGKRGEETRTKILKWCRNSMTSWRAIGRFGRGTTTCLPEDIVARRGFGDGGGGSSGTRKPGSLSSSLVLLVLLELLELLTASRTRFLGGAPRYMMRSSSSSARSMVDALSGYRVRIWCLKDLGNC